MPCAKNSHQSNIQNSDKTEHQNCAFEDLDHSILQHPLHSGVRNVKQILKCLQDATKEVKDIILNECNIIYECRVCASLFRGLANFMYHKRCYCKNHLCEEMLLFNNFEEDAVIVQPDLSKEKNPPESESTVENSDNIIDVEKIDSNLDELSSVPEAKIPKPKQRGRKSNDVKKFVDPMVSRRTRDKRKRGKKSVKVVAEFTETGDINVKETVGVDTDNGEFIDHKKQFEENENIIKSEETDFPDKTKAQIVDLRKDCSEFKDSYKIVGRSEGNNNVVDKINNEESSASATQASNEMPTILIESDKKIKSLENKIPDDVQSKLDEVTDMDCEIIESDSLNEHKKISNEIDIIDCIKSEENEPKESSIDTVANGKSESKINNSVKAEDKAGVNMDDCKKENATLDNIISTSPKLTDAIENLKNNSLVKSTEINKKLIPKNIIPMKNIIIAKPKTIQIKNAAVFESIRKNLNGKGNIGLSQITQAASKDVKCLPKIILKTIDSSSRAVFQTNEKILSKFETSQNSTASIKSEKEKVILVLNKNSSPQESSLSANKIILKEESKDLKPTEAHHMTRRKRLLARNDCNVQELKCLICNTIFTSLKTLYFHMLSIHSKKRLYYPCPLCKALFVQIYGATRHLQMKHGKNKEQINKLRDSIKKKCVWKKVDDLCIYNSVKKNEDSLMENKSDNLSTKSDDTDELNTSSINNLNKEPIVDSNKVVNKESNKVSHQCSKCGRVFGRKSSQVSHEKFCIMNAIKAEPVDVIPETLASQPMVSLLSLSPQKPNIEVVSNKTIHQVLNSNVSQIGISIRPKRKAEKQMHKDFINSQTLKWRSVNKMVNIPKVTSPIIKKDVRQNLDKKETFQNLEKKVISQTVKKDISPSLKKDISQILEKKVSNIMDTTDLICLKCKRTFSSFSNLKRHVAIHVGWTRFKCKNCDYQSYNKSQCLFHIQKAHNIPDDAAEEWVQDLRSNSRLKKSDIKSANRLKSTVASSSKTTSVVLKKKVNDISNEKKSQSIKKENSVGNIDTRKDKSLNKKNVGDAKKDLNNVKNEQNSNSELKKVLLDLKRDAAIDRKDKYVAVGSVNKANTGDLQKDGSSYKSVTTSNPTTIILSKKVPATSVQSATLSAESQSSKTFTLRSSPRKSETKSPEDKGTYLVTRSNTQTKGAIQIKLAPPNKNDSVEVEKKPSNIDKTFVKKDKLISEWFPKKDLNSNTSRRESAPLIIGLVPASSSGFTARSKNPAITYEKNNS